MGDCLPSESLGGR